VTTPPSVPPVQKPAFSTLLVHLADAGHRQLVDEFDVLGRMRRAPFSAFKRRISPSSFGLAPSRATTIAVTASPYLSSGTPMAATIATSARARAS
jgi:hypothetical protein